MGTAIVVQSWRLPLAAITTTIRRHRASVRMASVSRAWLQEYEAESVKHDEVR